MFWRPRSMASYLHGLLRSECLCSKWHLKSAANFFRRLKMVPLKVGHTWQEPLVDFVRRAMKHGTLPACKN